MKLPVSEIFEFVRNGLSVQHELDSGGLPITRIETIANATINLERVGYAGISLAGAKQYILQDGDILFSHINSVSHLGKCAIYNKELGSLVHGMNLLCFRVKSEKLHPKFALYLIRSNHFKSQLAKSIKKSVNQASVSTGDIKKIILNIPPLADQQRIAALLDTADRVLKQRESAIAKLDQLAQSVYLNELRACDSSIFQLAEVAEMYQPKTISANELIENGQYVVYGANGVIGRYDKFNHADSEVLVTCRGATCGTVNWSQPYAWITGNAMVVKPLNNMVTKDFLHYYFKFAADFSTVITGAAQPQITRQTLSRLTIVIPKLENQNKITNALKEIYKKHDFMNLSKNKLHELIRALQHQLFAVN